MPHLAGRSQAKFNGRTERVKTKFQKTNSVQSLYLRTGDTCGIKGVSERLQLKSDEQGTSSPSTLCLFWLWNKIDSFP